MAVAVPKRRSTAQAAPAPSRTAPPEPRKRPRDRPRPGGQGRSAAASPAPAKRKSGAPRKVRTDDPPRKPGRRKATSARAAAAKAVPARRKTAPKRRSGGQLIPLAAGHAGRAAVAVTQLPESGLIHRLTRGRAWIGVLGLLLVGIVALNVVTLSFAASSGKVDAKNTELGKENSVLQSLVAKKYGQARLRSEATALGLKMPTEAVPQLVDVRRGDVAEAASRLAAAAGGTDGAAATSGEDTTSAEESGASEEAASAGAASGEEGVTGEEAAAGAESSAETTGEGEFTPEELAIYEREYEELLAAEGVTEVPAE